MTLLTLCQAVAPLAGVSTPTTIVGNTSDNELRFLQFVTDAGEELVRRFDWAALLKSGTVIGSGTDAAIGLPADFQRLQTGLACTAATGAAVRGGLSHSEWTSLAPVEGTPRFFSVRGFGIRFYPYLSASDTATVHYISKNWIIGGKSAFTADGDTFFFSDPLMRLSLLWRWKRHTGQSYADAMEEYEAVALQLFAEDQRMRSGL